MNRSKLAMACPSLGFAMALIAAGTPVFAAQPAVTGTVSPVVSPAKNVFATKPALACLKDLRAFDVQMRKDGYWLGGPGYGYPMVGYQTPGMVNAPGAGYQNVRPGYEVRALVAAANILARHGQAKSCEDVLATTRDAYKTYVSQMRSGKLPTVDATHWRQNQIAAAQPVANATTAFRSDELLGTDVRDPHDNALGSVDDLVMSPHTGKIAYLVIGRGGMFGIGEKYVPVPWGNFKATAGMNLLVLDTTKAVLDAAPRVTSDKFAASGHFDQESQKVDAYWKAHVSNKTGSNN